LIPPVKAARPASAKAITKPVSKPEATPVSATAPEVLPEAAVVVPVAPIAKPEPVKTYTDEEILASVKNPETKPDSKPFAKNKPVPAPAKPKISRRTPDTQTRLWIGLGSEHELAPIDFVNAVAGETGLPGKVVGTIDVRERHSFMDVDTEHLNAIVAKMNRAQIKGFKVKVKTA
jgi:ATP-dependent RNA helicase DeaD